MLLTRKKVGKKKNKFYFSGDVKEITKFLFSIFDSLEDSIFVKDEKHQMVVVNDSYCKLMGLKHNQIFGKSDYDLFKKEEVDEFWESDDKVMRTGKSCVTRRSMSCPNNKVLLTSTRKILYTASTGKKYIVGIITDITDFEESKEALKRTETRLDIVFKASPLAIMLIRLSDKKFLEVNDCGIKMLGYKKSEFFDYSLEELKILREKDVMKIGDIIRSDGSFRNLEFQYFTKDREEKMGLFAGELLEVDGEECLVQVVCDITNRKRAEQELKNEEQNYRLLAENMPLGILTIDLEGNIQYLNNYIIEMLKAPSKEAVKSINLLRTSFLRQIGVESKIKECIDKKIVLEYEVPVKSQWGSDLYLFLYLSPTRDSQGMLNGVQILAEDITKRKLAESELEEKEKHYRTLFETTGSATCIVESDFVVTFVNQRMLDISGYTREEFGGKVKLIDFVAEDDVERVTKYHTDRRKGIKNVPNFYEFKFLSDRKKGVIDVFVSVSVIPGTDKTVASIIDISDRKKTEMALKIEHEARKELEYVVNQGPVVVLLLKNEEGWPIQFVSDNVEQFDYCPEEIKKYTELILEEDLDLIKEKMFDFAMEGTEEYVLKYRIKKKNESLVWVEHRVWVCRDEEGEISHYQGVLFDITDKKMTEDQNFELYKHLGMVNRKVAILADLNRESYTRNEKERLDAVTSAARNLAQAMLCFFYEYSEKEKKFYLLSADVKDMELDIDVNSIQTLDINNFSWLKGVAENKVRFQGNTIDDDIKSLNFGDKIQSFLFLPMVERGNLKSGLFLGFMDKTPVNTQELTFYDLFVMHASVMLKAGV